MASPSGDAQSQCPVDHSSREAWLKMSRQSQPSSVQSIEGTSQKPSPLSIAAEKPLGKERQTSSIPRSLDESGSRISETSGEAAVVGAAAKSTLLHSANAESADTKLSPSGHWLYPSEEMFFNAMKRKSYNPDKGDMPSIVPIHNAVNERTWHEILRWERRQGSFEKCGGPKLISFSGDSSKLTPRARLFSWLGYQPPFDRHDWIVDRCGARVDYVIDYYQGKGQRDHPSLSFYLDVRPKLNSLEGWKMRFMRFVGW